MLANDILTPSIQHKVFGERQAATEGSTWILALSSAISLTLIKVGSLYLSTVNSAPTIWWNISCHSSTKVLSPNSYYSSTNKLTLTSWPIRSWRDMLIIQHLPIYSNFKWPVIEIWLNGVSFSFKAILHNENGDFSGIRTQIFGIEGTSMFDHHHHRHGPIPFKCFVSFETFGAVFFPPLLSESETEQSAVVNLQQVKEDIQSNPTGRRLPLLPLLLCSNPISIIYFLLNWTLLVSRPATVWPDAYIMFTTLKIRPIEYVIFQK